MLSLSRQRKATKTDDHFLYFRRLKYKFLSVCLFIYVSWHINLCRLFNAKSIFIQISCSFSNNSVSAYVCSLNVKTALFQAVTFCINTVYFYFDTYIGPYLVPLLRARVDLRAMAMRWYYSFPKAPALLKPHHQIVQEVPVV